MPALGSLAHIEAELAAAEAELLELHRDLQAAAILVDIIIRDDKPNKDRRLKVTRMAIDRIKAMAGVYEDAVARLEAIRAEHLVPENVD